MPAKEKTQKPQREKGVSRDVILEAASDEFASHGFAGARIDAIAQRTALNVRMIYYHFTSKEGLYQAVLEAIYRHMFTVLDDTEGGAVPPETQAHLAGSELAAVAAFSRYVDLLSQHPRFADILVREAIDGGKRLEELFRSHPELYDRVHVRAHQLLEQGIRGGVLREVDPALVVHSLTGMVCLLTAARSAQSLFLGGRTIEPSQWKTTLVELFLHGIAKGRP